MAYAPSAYQSPVYDEKKYRQGIDTSYYTNAAKQYEQQQNQNRQQQIGEAQKTQQSDLRQAYISKMQNEKNLGQSLATSGIRGGATETSNLRLANIYGQAVGNANTNYSNSVNAINQSIDQNIANYKADMASKAEEYVQNQANARWQAAREDYENALARQREDKLNAQNRADMLNQRKYERAQAETARQTEYWSNYYINKYSGYSKKDLKKAEKTITANLKKAKTANEKIRWEQALAGIGARRGVIKNK